MKLSIMDLVAELLTIFDKYAHIIMSAQHLLILDL
jgi:hypothetical protein